MVTRGRLITTGALACGDLSARPRHGRRQAQDQPVATFKSSVDLVRVSAVVRDQKGRFVQRSAARDFEVLDGGQTRPITDFRHDLAGVSVALLFDVSGSMEGTAAERARSGDARAQLARRRGATRRRSSRSTRSSTR